MLMFREVKGRTGRIVLGSTFKENKGHHTGVLEASAGYSPVAKITSLCAW